MNRPTRLDDIRISTPCEVIWDDMAGDDRVRFCSACSRPVYNIIAMTSAEATAMIEGREGRLCARIYKRSDGTVLTSDCPVAGPTESPPRPRPRRIHALALVLAALVVSWAGGAKHDEARPTGPGVTWDDWVHWAAVSLGLKPTPPPTPTLTTTIVSGDVY